MKSKFTIILILALITFFSIQTGFSQGCVAIRNMSCSGGAAMISGNTTGLLHKGEFQALMGYRHFKSFRHFRGKNEEANRVADGTEVINHFNSFDLGLSYSLSSRLSLTAILPVTINDRSSLYEHYGNSEVSNPEHKRFHTNSAGAGDIRLSATYWMLNPSKYSKGNFAIGLGIKAPTGNPGVEDDFHKLDSLGNDYTVRRPVDQSIQLGDGGWGINLEIQGYHLLFNNANVYFSGFYLSNPREVNDVLRSSTSNPGDPYSYFSVADQYAARLGFNYLPMPDFGVSVGGRVEGVPSEDLTGGSKGFRRPGYIISVEPGIAYSYRSATFNLNAPIAIFRNRVQSAQDKEKTAQTGVYTIGDAAFADYLINATLTYRFGGKSEMDHQQLGDVIPPEN
ncbi:MAG: hypothetical protein EPO28_05845 [Saprospiraceae bacterium]|nr:MAG: hypothetical protein EPO28_05845 [Saprospiraceae bacterium]